MLDKKFDDFVIIVNQGFQEQKDYTEGKFRKIDKKLDAISNSLDDSKRDIANISLRLLTLDERIDKLKKEINYLIKIGSVDILATNKAIDKLQVELAKIRLDVDQIKSRK